MAALQAAAVEHGEGLDDCWAWSRERLAQVLSWPDSLLDKVEHYRQRHGSSPQLKIPSNVLTPPDQIWPQGLNKLDRPPLVLHRQGRADVLAWLGQRRAVAVVGTRAASDHGLRMAEHLGSFLAGAGWPVVSGLAEGIDAAAHRGCLAADGVPVAVLGTPLDRVYPRHHQALQEEVARNGLLLSERQPGESVQPGHFAARNRLLVSLSCALVVVECPDRSGALISARLASEQRCPVWVVPGEAGRWSSRGSNRLLQNAAAPLLSPKELVEHLGPGPCHKANATAPALVKALGAGASIEQLQQTLKLPAGRLASDLLELELAGQVVCESGFLWKPCRP
ncbi:DNA recombination-mediator protein A [Synechococcus sp. BOUM118]|nr:DNA recombination-mediator protein A [Synechococcus sp. BOUM118]